MSKPDQKLSQALGESSSCKTGCYTRSHNISNSTIATTQEIA